MLLYYAFLDRDFLLDYLYSLIIRGFLPLSPQKLSIYAVIEKLLIASTNVNYQDSNSRIALHLAARKSIYLYLR
jgi:hypothetical protein